MLGAVLGDYSYQSRVPRFWSEYCTSAGPSTLQNGELLDVSRILLNIEGHIALMANNRTSVSRLRTLTTVMLSILAQCNPCLGKVLNPLDFQGQMWGRIAAARNA